MSATLKPVDSPKHVKPVKPFPKLEMPYLCWMIQMVILYMWSHLLICAEVSLKSVFLLLMRVHLCHSVKHEHKAPQKWYFRFSAPHTSWGNDHFCTAMCIANKHPQVDWEITGGGVTLRTRIPLFSLISKQCSYSCVHTLWSTLKRNS